MLYVRERRLWLLIKSTGDGASSHALLAMSTTRKTMDFEREFEKFKALVIDPTPTAKDTT
jgi:cytochrome c biogenesis protein